jgi:peroxiredoxin
MFPEGNPKSFLIPSLIVTEGCTTPTSAELPTLSLHGILTLKTTVYRFKSLTMARTLSTMLPLGTTAPDFALPDVVTGDIISLDTFTGAKALLVMFMCEHCPFVKHVQDELAKLGHDYIPQGARIVAISANDAENYPQDAPENLKAMADRLHLNYPICYDETQAVAQAYQAACTPDFFLFDDELRLVYRGQLDGSRPGNDIPVTGTDLRAALDAVLQGKPVSTEQQPSIGCNIKWKPGNAPAYFG